MLPEEEKSNIMEKVKFELEIKKSLSTPEEDKNSSWINSKIGLLLIGSLITGILVPWFQFTQKTIEWKRQNRFDSVNYKLEMMRDCVRNFVILQAYRAEAYERVQPYLLKASLTKDDYNVFKNQYIELQNKNFAQNAKVTSLIVAFTAMNKSQDERRASLGVLFENYIHNSTLYMRDIDRSIQNKYCKSNAEDCADANANDLPVEDAKQKIDQYMAELNKGYSRLVSLMANVIREEEKENERFRF